MDSSDVVVDIARTGSVAASDHLAPTMIRLGTLSDLTLAGWNGIPDGLGGGDGSFLPP